MAQRTGRTLDELFNGGPGRAPMSALEFTQWRALIEIVEPYEREQNKS